MHWEKLGRIFVPDGSIPWMQTHAAVPIPELIEGNLYRIYFSSRDANNRAHVGWITISMDAPLEIIDYSKEPLLTPGTIGTFDDSGALGNYIINVKDKKYLYYTGFNLGVLTPFRYAIGLSISEDNGNTFKKFSKGPIIDRNSKEPYFMSSPSILYENNIFRAWYVSCVNWSVENDKLKHYYHIKSGESENGVDWKLEGIVCIDFKNRDEYAIASPRVVYENGIYKMWYSCRGEFYKIGYAESSDGIVWQRKDEWMDFTVSETGWDSEMVEYSYIFDHKNARYMLYNGNGYGKTGFGIAKLIK